MAFCTIPAAYLTTRPRCLSDIWIHIFHLFNAGRTDKVFFFFHLLADLFRIRTRGFLQNTWAYFTTRPRHLSDFLHSYSYFFATQHFLIFGYIYFIFYSLLITCRPHQYGRNFHSDWDLNVCLFSLVFFLSGTPLYFTLLFTNGQTFMTCCLLLWTPKPFERGHL